MVMKSRRSAATVLVLLVLSATGSLMTVQPAWSDDSANFANFQEPELRQILEILNQYRKTDLVEYSKLQADLKSVRFDDGEKIRALLKKGDSAEIQGALLSAKNSARFLDEFSVKNGDGAKLTLPEAFPSEHATKTLKSASLLHEKYFLPDLESLSLRERSPELSPSAQLKIRKLLDAKAGGSRNEVARYAQLSENERLTACLADLTSPAAALASSRLDGPSMALLLSPQLIRASRLKPAEGDVPAGEKSGVYFIGDDLKPFFIEVPAKPKAAGYYRVRIKQNHQILYLKAVADRNAELREGPKAPLSREAKVTFRQLSADEMRRTDDHYAVLASPGTAVAPSRLPIHEIDELVGVPVDAADQQLNALLSARVLGALDGPRWEAASLSRNLKNRHTLRFCQAMKFENPKVTAAFANKMAALEADHPFIHEASTSKTGSGAASGATDQPAAVDPTKPVIVK